MGATVLGLLVTVMKETNLNIFYHFGASFEDLKANLTVQMETIPEPCIHLFLFRDWLEAFLKETQEFSHELKDTRHSAQHLSSIVHDMLSSYKKMLNSEDHKSTDQTESN